MFLSNLFKKNKNKQCEHVWHHVLNSYGHSFDGYQIKTYDTCIIYCPKCKMQDVVTTQKWERIQRIQQIDEEFSNSNGINCIT